MMRRMGLSALLVMFTGVLHPLWGQAPELGRIPANAFGVVHVRVGGVYTSPSMKGVRELVAKAGPEAMKILDDRFQITPFQIDRVTAIAMMPDLVNGEMPPFAVMVTTLVDIKTENLGQRLEMGAPQDPKSKYPQWVEGKIALAVPEPRILLFGDKALVEKLATTPSGAPGKPLEKITSSDLSLWVNLGALPPQLADFLPPPYAPLAKAKQISATLNIESNAKLKLEVEYGTEAEAKAADSILRALAKQATAMLVEPKKEMLKALEKPGTPRPSAFGEMPEAMAGLMGLAGINYAEKMLSNPPLKQTGSLLAAELTAPDGVPPAMLGVGMMGLGITMPAIQQARGAAGRMSSANNLKQMALAFHNYTDSQNAFPTDITDKKTGKPLLSWRVQLLPYMEQAALYQQFKLDEPWDSENNLKLARMIVPVYVAPNQPPSMDPKGLVLTPYQAASGPGTLFEPGKKLGFRDVTDGTSNTVMFVEAKKQVIWTKPDDVPFDPTKPLPAANTIFGGLSPNGFNVAMGDGSVRFLKYTIDPKTIKAMITRAGGEVFNLD